MSRFNIVARIKSFTRKQRQLLKDIHARQVLADLVGEPNYFPATGSSLNSHSLATVINDLIINDRKCMIEFGAGISTLYVARLIRQKSLNLQLISVDDNSKWLEIMKSHLAEESLSDLVQFVHAPLAKSTHSLDSLLWYDEVAIEDVIGSTSKFDVVLVDGPMAWQKKTELARYPAIPFMNGRLSDRCVVFLDDSYRKGEQQVLKRWAQEFKLAFVNVNPVFSMANRGKSFNPVA